LFCSNITADNAGGMCAPVNMPVDSGTPVDSGATDAGTDEAMMDSATDVATIDRSEEASAEVSIEAGSPDTASC
jgi:hypothetical protein